MESSVGRLEVASSTINGSSVPARGTGEPGDRVRLGQLQFTFTDAAALHFEHEGERYPAVLRTVLPAVDTATRTREARLSFPDESPLPGAAGRLAWRDSRLHVPPALVVERGGALGVFVVEGGAARFVALPEAEAGRPAALSLPPEARIVVRGHLGLREGERVSAR